MKRFFQNEHVRWGITITVSLCLVVMFSKIFDKFGDIEAFKNQLAAGLEPIIIGFVIAFLLCPMMDFLRSKLDPLFIKIFKEEHKETAIKVSNGLSVTISVVTFILGIGVLLWLLIPQLYDSIIRLYDEIPNYAKNVEDFLSRKLSENEELVNIANNYLNNFEATLTTYFKEHLLPNMADAVGAITHGIAGGVRFIVNFVVGIAIAVYILTGKTHIIAQLKKIVYGIFSKENGDIICKSTAHVNHIFEEYITGKLIDSVIIGCICFVFCRFVNMPYAILVSVVVGVTNIIPFFGPFIGAIPSALLILVVNPKMCLVFLIFILILQQIDGNLIGPLVLGDSTGMSGLWVMVAILIGGKIWGFAGMVLSVPICACIYTLINLLVSRSLKKKGMESNTMFYEDLLGFDRDGNAIHGVPVKKRSFKKHLFMKKKSEEESDSEEKNTEVNNTETNNTETNNDKEN